MKRTLSHLLCSIWLVIGVQAFGQALDLAITTGENTVISGTSGADHEIFARQAGGSWTLFNTTMTNLLPAESQITAFENLAFGTNCFSLDTDALLQPGNLSLADEDVADWNGTTFLMRFDGSSKGLPPEVAIDAIGRIFVAPLVLIISLDSDCLLTVNGTPTMVADEDLVQFSEASNSFTAVIFDGSAEGIPPEADLDAASYISGTDWRLSFDIPLLIGSVNLDDADVIAWDSATTDFGVTASFVAASNGVLPEVDLKGLEYNFLDPVTPTASPSPVVPTSTPTPSRTPTVSPSRTPTTSPSASPSVSPTITPSASRTPSASPSPSPSVSPTPSASPTVSPSPTASPSPFNDASVVTHTIPTQIPKLYQVPITITMQNTGNTTWPGAGNFVLGVTLDACALSSVSALTITPATNVLPGQNYVFSGILNGPAAGGPCQIDFRMTDGVTPFGATATQTLSLVDPINNASFLGNTIPTTMYTNQSLLVGTNVRNLGNTWWMDQSISPSRWFGLLAVADPCGLHSTSIPMPAPSQAPNTNGDFNYLITAPATPGLCNFQLRMIVVEGSVVYFGATLNVNINVINPPNAVRNWEVFE